ncbi:D-isomer specific 2-hydroxyacid dehydrogenase family protein [Aspergillus tubingensis]|uniref:D-isomer specific 2-hydroxyacid dehydrogenase family protein n=1 Tax=Aspergillus tubingensis TaxID=5068 RepID=UPI0015792F62|nr:D-2-hydroxyacid dehydrogenase [Aspergillus tubingensis]GFN12474.1 D-2-hydroxyacid dehydrogenase [Aspergillus tubingensis]GLB19821.1 hypothetical protein AtubIFM61612_009743 [Aspergillus tubingensis]
MGEAPPVKEHLVIAYARDLPQWLIDETQAKFPDAELSILQLPNFAPIPAEIARKITLLVTFSNLPAPEDASKIKLIHSLSSGLDHLLSHPIVKETSIPLTSSSGIHGPPIAEWTIMNWLVASRRFVYTHENQQKHIWAKNVDFMNTVHDQVGRKIGILGYGSIGRQIGRVASALGMQVHAYTASPRPTPASRKDNGYIVPGTGDRDGTIPVSWHHGTDKASIHEFLSLGLDHLVIALPLTPQTTRMLGAEEFEILSNGVSAGRPRPYLTNISRGKVLDQDALIKALKEGVLGGAALDVADPEPLPEDSPLWDTPNVQISPHVSSAGREYIPRSLDIMRENVGRLERGEELLNGFKRGRGY